MANRRLETLDVHELVRLKRAGIANAQIGRLLGCSRQTVVKYLRWAKAEGLLAGEMPEPGALVTRLEAALPERQAPQQVSSLAALEAEVRDLRDRGMEIAAIRVRLEERHGRTVSYEALRRLVRRIEPRPAPETFGRIEVRPGEEAQVDFGYAGLTLDPATGQVRKTWVFVLLLSWSRYMFCWLVYDQTVATWLECHRRALTYFGGVPERIVLDNLKAAIVKACREDPAVQRSYRECAEHYGFLIDPNPPARPHLKGKVEKGGVHYVKRNFLVVGQTGVGKTHLAQAFSHEAARKGFDVLFTTAHRMLLHLHAARGEGSYERRLAAYLKPDLLVIDDFGLRPLPPNGPGDLYDVIDGRYEKRSLVLTSNRAPTEWAEMLGDALLANAALDRLLDRAHVVTITGRSYRLAGRADPKEVTADANAA